MLPNSLTRTNAILPYLQAPASFKRLLGSPVSSLSATNPEVDRNGQADADRAPTEATRREPCALGPASGFWLEAEVIATNDSDRRRLDSAIGIDDKR